MNIIKEREIITKFQKNPIEFFKFFWGNDIVLWDGLEEIINSVVNNKRTVVRSGHGIGKSWLMGRLALWFLFCHYPSKVITTAPTWTQVSKILWGELRNAYLTSTVPLGGKLLQLELKLNEDWFATGISTSQTVDQRDYGAVKLQGYHSPNMLFILDEGAGVPKEIWVASTSLLTGDNNKIVAIGNPASPKGEFYDAFKSPIWNKIAISCYDHPNVKEGRQVIAGCVSKDWIEERKIEWGENSPLFKAKVLGEFPDEGEDTLIPLSLVEKAVIKEHGWTKAIKMGCDVARFGSDETVIYESDGVEFRLVMKAVGKDTNETIGRITRHFKDNNLEVVGVDDIGVGGGVSDGCKNAGLNVHRVNFGESAIESDKFANLKAEIFWILREKFRAGDIKIPDDPILINQLSCIKYGYNRKGQILIEGKDEMKKRGLKSPDRADALAICHYAGLGKALKIRFL